MKTKHTLCFALVALALIIGAILPLPAAAKTTELIWLLPGAGSWPYPDAEMVYAKLNEILEKDLGVKVTFKIPGAFGDYNQKVPVSMDAGEQFDIVWTASWSNNYLTAVNKELYAPLNDLLPKYAPTIWNDTKVYLEKGASVNGKIYGVWNQQISANTSNFVVWEPHVEKYGWKIDAVKALADIEPFLADLKAKEPDLIPVSTRNSPETWAMFSLGHVPVNGLGFDLVRVNVDDPQCKVFLALEDPGVAAQIKLARDWYNKGYIAQDGITYTNDQWQKLWNSGKVGIDLHNTWVPGMERQKMPWGVMTIRQPYFQPFGKTIFSPGGISATMEAVSALSKNQEKAVQLLEYLWTHPDAYNLLVYGIEGKHYKKLDDGRIEVDPNAGYYINGAWVYGNTFISYPVVPQPANLHQLVRDLNASAYVPTIMGFVPNMDELKTALASVKTAGSEHSGVTRGYLDPEKALPAYVAALKAAGVEDLMKTLQAQIDAWLASQK